MHHLRGAEIFQLARERHPILNQEDEADGARCQEIGAEPKTQPRSCYRVFSQVDHERGFAPVRAQPAPKGLFLPCWVEYLRKGLGSHCLDAAVGHDERVQRGPNAEVVRPTLNPGLVPGYVGVRQDNEGDHSWDEGQWAERRVQNCDTRRKPP